MTRFRPLHCHGLHADTQLAYFDDGLAIRVRLEDEAVRVMTDLHRVPPATVHPEVTIDEAMQRMIHIGVRMLFAVDTFGDLQGLITARDILGEKPVQVAAEHQQPRDQVRVRDIMTPRGRIEVLDFAEVERSCVGDVVVTLRNSGRQHALVQEENAGRTGIRGIFSISQIGRQLGVEIEANGVVQSFAELEQLLTQNGA